MIEFSDLKEMPKALVKLQGEIIDPKKTTTGHNYKYADLHALLADLKPLLASNGFSVIQSPYNVGDMVGVETLLIHESGEWVKGSFDSTLAQGGMLKGCQAIGSQITYYRRYGLMALLNIAPEDDDGAEASNNGKTYSTSPKYTGEPKDYIVPIGKKFKGQKLEAVPYIELVNFIEWLKKQDKKDAKAQEFIEIAEKFMDSK